ncbi:HAMP domain-containing sensor histidine kinase [Phycisphaerales bacterium ac7]|nr:HAMP domain-containing histidine kinase [bacterium]
MAVLQGVLIGLAIGTVIGVPVVWFELKRQIKRARAAERRARNAERLAEIGAMTAGLAHEIKNPLSTIGLNAELLSEAIADLPGLDEDDRSSMRRRVGVLQREAERLRDTLGDFLRFAGEIRLVRERHDLNEVVDELIDFFLPQAQHHNIRMRAELGRGPMEASLDASHFKQALLNLLLNAVQAMTEGPGAESTRAKELIVRTTEVETDVGSQWAVHVIDTGPGISSGVAERIFTPYFTTKGGGSGLGLPTTKRLIEEHGGTIDVVSHDGQGTDFVVVIPKFSANPDQTA